jgi:hypothetical protein
MEKKLMCYHVIDEYKHLRRWLLSLAVIVTTMQNRFPHFLPDSDRYYTIYYTPQQSAMSPWATGGLF